jgi:hypothetical protein
MNLTPVKTQLLSDKNRPMSFASVVEELIDNAGDAGATEIELTIKPNTLVILDNGEGVKDFEAMLTHGRHEFTGVEKVGRYGVGLKQAGARLWGIMVITSVRDHSKRSVKIDWEEWLQSNSWEMDNPSVEPAPGEASWTRITFKNTEKGRIPSGQNLDVALRNVSFLYAPAVELGIKISVKRLVDKVETAQKFTGWSWPKLTETIDVMLNVEGKKARLRAGVVPPHEPNLRSGLHYTYLHRTILEGSSVGCGEYSNGRIFGVVTLLGGEWCLTTNKDNIDEDLEELSAAVFAQMEPLLLKAEAQSQHVDLSLLENSLSSQLTQMFSHGKEQRDPGTSKGTHSHNDPPATQGKKASKIQAGTGKKRGPKEQGTGITLDLSKSFDLPDVTQVEYEQRRVSLNNAHPWVRWLLKQKPEIKELAILVLAAAAIVDVEPRTLYPVERGEKFRFTEKMGLHLKEWIGKKHLNQGKE